MEIKVERTLTDEELVFTIRLRKPDQMQMSDVQVAAIGIVDKCRSDLEEFEGLQTAEDTMTHHFLKNRVREAHFAIINTYIKTMEQAIEELMKDDFIRIEKEINNWILDSQTGKLKAWIDLLCCRSRFYFDNDAAMQRAAPQQSEYEEEDDREWMD